MKLLLLVCNMSLPSSECNETTAINKIDLTSKLESSTMISGCALMGIREMAGNAMTTDYDNQTYTKVVCKEERR